MLFTGHKSPNNPDSQPKVGHRWKHAAHVIEASNRLPTAGLIVATSYNN